MKSRHSGPLTSIDYWDAIWSSASITDRAIDPRDPTTMSFADRAFLAEINAALQGMSRSSLRIVEVGCARSRWLPYFSKHCAMDVHGIDYSAVGCDYARQLVAASGASCSIWHADMFAPPRELLGTFDVAISFGLIEHFEDTSTAIAAIAALLRPGGLIFTSVPNMAGFTGWLQKLIADDIFDRHVALTLADLRLAHENCGLTVVEAKHVIPFNAGVIAYHPMSSWHWKRLLLRALNAITFATRLIGVIAPLPSSGIFSPYEIVVARKG